MKPVLLHIFMLSALPSVAQDLLVPAVRSPVLWYSNLLLPETCRMAVTLLNLYSTDFRWNLKIKRFYVPTHEAIVRGPRCKSKQN
jgi:hypothetical protein